jgi:hypothetical protein
VRLLAALALLFAAGCGAKPPKPAAPKLTPAQREVANVAETFVRALGRRDWTAACATRSYDDHLALARQAGTCERALQLAFAHNDLALVSRTIAGTVRIDGDRAGIDMVQRGAKRTRLRLFAVREGGQWLLEDLQPAP